MFGDQILKGELATLFRPDHSKWQCGLCGHQAEDQGRHHEHNENNHPQLIPEVPKWNPRETTR